MEICPRCECPTEGAIAHRLPQECIGALRDKVAFLTAALKQAECLTAAPVKSHAGKRVG